MSPPALDALFPLCLRCTEAGELIDATGDLTLLPPDGRRAAWLDDLLANTRDLRGPVPVGALDPAVDGFAERSEPGEITIRLRGLETLPAARKTDRRRALYEAVLRTGPVFVHVHDRDMRSLWASSQLRPELGYDRLPKSREETLAYVHPDDVEAVLEDRSRQLASGDTSMRRRYRVRAADGSWRWLLSAAINLEDEEAVGGVVVHALDITEEVRREQEALEGRRRLNAVIDALEDAVFVVSDDRIAFANAAAAALMPGEVSVDELVGLPADEALRHGARHLDEPAGFIASMQGHIARGEPIDGLRLRTSDGRVLDHYLRSVSTAERAPERVWIVRDVTARVEADERKHNLLELERLARQTAERRNASLQQLDRLKTEFVASVSHELRTPLAALVSFLDLLGNGSDTPLSEEQRSLVEAAGRTAARLRRLVDDLLILAELQSESIAVRGQDIDVSSLLREIATEVRAGRPGSDLLVSSEPGPILISDRLRVVQVVENLIDNALKYGGSDGPVRCVARPIPTGWEIEVRDRGPGIAADERAHVLQPFTRGRRAAEVDVPGSGLGLALCSELARRLHGRLDLETGAEDGMIARLTLPHELPAEEPR